MYILYIIYTNNNNIMDTFKIAVFGCWNVGCDKNSGQQYVSDLIKLNENNYEFMVILGDNYYARKKTIIDDGTGTKLKIKLTNITDLKKGFACLEHINLEKKIIMGNHDIEDSLDKGCSIIKSQLKLPWYDVKFPFGFDMYYLYGNEKNTYNKTILFIYLDTTMYSSDINDDNSCYKHVLNKDIRTLKQEQNTFIVNTLKLVENKLYNISDVVFFGHEPLLTFKQKKGQDLISIIDELLLILFEQKTKYIDVQFHWICADYHIYQNSVISSKTDDKLNISQWIFGTGGGELDNVVSKNELDIELYKLKILPNVVFNHNGTDVSSTYNNTNGLDKFGYGEITFDLCSVSHKFILSNYNYPSKKKDKIKSNDIALIDDYKLKYLKYKNKYVELKKN